MTQRASLDLHQLRSAIQDEYAEVAACPTKGFHFHTGRILADRLGYPKEQVDALPDPVVESFAGVGNPFSWGEPAVGATVLDQGSGAGFDALLAAMHVGPTGHVMGIDMTPAMVHKAQHNAALIRLENVAFCEGELEALPIADDSVDQVISNGVVNLCPDKAAVLAETYRVLKPGGRYHLSDIVVGRDVGDDARADISLWTG
jgi:arsenite methyltransferase